MKKEINYCGFGKSLLIRPPYWAFVNASCFIHDQNYSKGGTKEDRFTADFGFLKHMLLDINGLSFKKKRRATIAALIYYRLVRLFGWISFNYHD